MRALTSLDISNNLLGELVLPDGWTIDQNGYNERWKAEWIYKHSDGTVQKGQHPGKPEGIIAIADAIPDMGAISIVNVLSNNIGDEQAQELIKIMQSKERLTTLCGFSSREQDTNLDLSKKGLSSGCAMLIANEMKEIRGVQVLNISLNEIQFSNELCMTFLRLVIHSGSGLRIQVKGNNFSAVNKHTMEFVLLEMLGQEEIPTEVNVESAGLTGYSLLSRLLQPFFKS
jgi:hypothetical protein